MSNQAIITALAIQHPALSSYPLTLPKTKTPLQTMATGVRLKAKARCWNYWFSSLRNLITTPSEPTSIVHLQLAPSTPLSR